MNDSEPSALALPSLSLLSTEEPFIPSQLTECRRFFLAIHDADAAESLM